MDMHEVMDEKETGRIEAFSDGVFAIAITLLVLDIKVPHIHGLPIDGGLLGLLLRQWPAYLSYFISFVTILIIWVSHHRLFSYIKRSNDMFMFLNGVLLMLVTFIPFPTALLSEYVRTEYANLVTAIYSGTYLMVAVMFNVIWLYASKNKRLLSRKADPCLVGNITRQYMFGPPLYFLAFLLSFVSPALSVADCFILAIFFALTGAISRLLPCNVCQIESPK